MDRPPFFAFYPADFANDINVEAMSTLQVGAYLLLLCKAWQADPPASLPTDDQVLARFARVSAEVWAEIKLGVLVPFRLGTDQRLHNRRLRLEYDKALNLIRAKQEAGKKGAENRWSNKAKNGSAIAEPLGVPMAGQCDRNAIQIQTQSQTKTKDKEKNPPTPLRGGEEKLPFDSPEFRKSWEDWKVSRKENKRPLGKTAIGRQLKKLGALAEDHAISTLELSITNGWQGLFPEQAKANLFGGRSGYRTKEEQFSEQFARMAQDLPRAKDEQSESSPDAPDCLQIGDGGDGGDD